MSTAVVRSVIPFKHSTLPSAPLAPEPCVREDQGHVPGLTGRSAAVRHVLHLIHQVAPHESNVLLLGESGTGKELAARATHEASPRRQRPFVAMNCGAIPTELVESELFGHEKGAFTGAIGARKGRFEIAEGGTLFLDEVGDMTLSTQIKLLRVLQERTFERVGSHTPTRCNVRIIAATHRNLEDAIARGTFREDLFHRLNVFPIEMPSLRSRIEDLGLLVRDFSDRNVSVGRSSVELTPKALGALRRYPWPGNVRELGNLIERLSIVCPDRRVDVADLPAKYRPVDELGDVDSRDGADADESQPVEDNEGGSPLERCLTDPADAQLSQEGLDLRHYLLAIECSLIQQALSRADGNTAHAARLLRLGRTTLIEKLRRLQLLGPADTLRS